MGCGGSKNSVQDSIKKNDNNGYGNDDYIENQAQQNNNSGRLFEKLKEIQENENDPEVILIFYIRKVNIQ